MDGLWGWTFWIRLLLSSRCSWWNIVLWNCWWQCSNWLGHWFWIITFPNYFGLTSCVFTIPTMIVMVMVVMMVWRWEPFWYYYGFPNFLPSRQPDLLPIWHPNLFEIFFPSQLFVGNEFKFFAWLPVLRPSLNPSEFLIRNPDLLLVSSPDLLPRLFPSEFLVVNPNLLLRWSPNLFEIFDPFKLFRRNPNCFLWWHPNFFPCALPNKLFLPQIVRCILPAFMILSEEFFSRNSFLDPENLKVFYNWNYWWSFCNEKLTTQESNIVSMLALECLLQLELVFLPTWESKFSSTQGPG